MSTNCISWFLWMYVLLLRAPLVTLKSKGVYVYAHALRCALGNWDSRLVTVLKKKKKTWLISLFVLISIIQSSICWDSERMEWIYNYWGLCLANSKTDYFYVNMDFQHKCRFYSRGRWRQKEKREGGNGNCSKVVLAILYLNVLIAGVWRQLPRPRLHLRGWLLERVARKALATAAILLQY